MFKTFVPEQREPNWVLIDAEGQPIGRVASKVAAILRGKNKVDWTPNEAVGDAVIIINADKAVFTGSKGRTKIYTRYSGYPGGLKEVKAADMLAKKPVKTLEHAVRGMLPKGPLGYRMYGRLNVYAGATHPHAAQKPVKVEVK